MRAKSEAGFLVAQPRLGYRAVRTLRGTVAEPDPETAPLVQRAFVEVAANGLSLRQVTRMMQEEGLKGRRGEPVSLATVQRILADPYYAGMTELQDGRLLLGTHVALVPLPLFLAAKEKINPGGNITNETPQPE